MLNNKFILSLGVVAILSTSSAAIAFQGNPSIAVNHNHNIIMVSNDTLEDGAKDFISNLTNEGINILKSTKNGEEGRMIKFQDLLKTNFDMKTIARFSLGRYWKTSSEAEKDEYLKLFEDMIVEVYSRRFNDYNGQVMEITSSRAMGKSDAIVKSILMPDDSPKVKVDWRVRKKKSGEYKVIDIIVEGVSMSLTQRSDFASVIQRGGGKTEVLLAHLRPKDKVSDIIIKN